MFKKIIRQKLLYLILLSSILLSGCVNYIFINRNNPTPVRESKLEKPIFKPDISIYFDWNKTIENSGEDSGRDIVIDVDGNVYLTGKEYNTSRGVSDILIAKYNNSGEQEWKTTFETDSDAIGYGIDIDDSQYLYITGYSENITSDVDVVLLKYDINGVYQWNQLGAVMNGILVME